METLGRQTFAVVRVVIQAHRVRDKVIGLLQLP